MSSIFKINIVAGKMVSIDIPYGNSTLSCEIPKKNILKVGYTSHLEEIMGVENAIIQHLRNPIGTKPLASLVKRGDKVAAIITDYTRPCPDNILLPPILRELKEGGVRSDDVTIIIATGLHASLHEKIKEKVSEEVLENYDVIFHDAESNEMISFGKTSRGVPIIINKIVAEADFKISTGFIEPHFFAGFSGGRKSIMPGVSAKESIWKNHSYKMIDNCNAKSGILEGNPVHEDSVEHAQAIGHNFVVNVVLNMNKKIGKIVAGDWKRAHEKGVAMDREVIETGFRQKADITLTSNNGYPLDLDLYQAVKGIVTASSITKKGGPIIIASECSNGVGPKEFWELHREAGSPDEVLETIKREEPIGVQWQNQMLARVQKEHEIYLVSQLPDNLVEDFIIKPAQTVESALELSLENNVKGAKIAILPEGPAVLPVLDNKN